MYIKNFARDYFVAPLRIMRTEFRRRFGFSDFSTWKNTKNLSVDWDARTRLLGKLVLPGESVIEFGAGRMVLPNYLPENCPYTPSDIVDRGDGTIICDLNRRPLPSFAGYDVAVLGGVLEYIHDVEGLISQLLREIGAVVISYAVTDLVPAGRRENGWVNDYDLNALMDLFSVNDAKCVYCDTWRGRQYIFRFEVR